MHLEENHSEWESIRARVDSLANAIFLISGGALSLSITVMVGGKGSRLISAEASAIAINAWYWLLIAVVLFLALKVHLILQVFTLHRFTDFLNRHVDAFNAIGWIIGFGGFGAFIWGMLQLVRAAAIVVSAS